MPGVSRDNDTAGGDLIASQTTVKANNQSIIVDGDKVEPHDPGGVHSSPQPTIVAGSKNVFIGGKAVVNAGDAASCGHTASGSGDVNVGD